MAKMNLRLVLAASAKFKRSQAAIPGVRILGTWPGKPS
jgi:hypothetical protein